MKQVSSYNSLLVNKQRLNEISLDGNSTGIETMVQNINKPSNIVVGAIIESDTPPLVIKPVYETLPNTEITLIPNRVEVANKKNNLYNKINNLPDKTKASIVFGLLGISLILLIIVIIK